MRWQILPNPQPPPSLSLIHIFLNNSEKKPDYSQKNPEDSENNAIKKRKENVVVVVVKEREEILPVSYTHLDVYKRQGGRISGGVEHRCAAAADLPKGEPVQRGAGGGWAAAAAGCPHRQRQQPGRAVQRTAGGGVQPFGRSKASVCRAAFRHAVRAGQPAASGAADSFLCRRAKRSAAGGQGGAADHLL